MVLLAIWDIFLHENNRNYNSYRFCYKLVFILFLSFFINQIQNSDFQQVSGLVSGYVSAFCLKRVALYYKAMPNSFMSNSGYDFLKGFSYMLFRFVVPLVL